MPPRPTSSPTSYPSMAGGGGIVAGRDDADRLGGGGSSSSGQVSGMGSVSGSPLPASGRGVRGERFWARPRLTSPPGPLPEAGRGRKTAGCPRLRGLPPLQRRAAILEQVQLPQLRLQVGRRVVE